jgi:hypothetical protein
MTLEKTRELSAAKSGLGSGPDSGNIRNAASIVPGAVMRDHGQDAVDVLIRENDLKKQWQIKSYTRFESSFKR